MDHQCQRIPPPNQKHYSPCNTLDNPANQTTWFTSHECIPGWRIHNIQAQWQESHRIEHKPRELLVLFLSCGILSAGSRTDNRPWPRQTLPGPHNFTMTSFTSMTFHSPNDGSHLQLNWATSSLKDHIIIKSSSRGLQWDFCWNPLRSFQDLGFKTSFEPRLVHL